MTTVVPESSTDSTLTCPPWPSTTAFVIDRPSPVPGVSARVALEAR